ncbi:MAG: sodium:proton antiporter, partial [Ekhidna sp.]
AEQVGIKMPSFFSYIVKYSIPILLPVLIIIWILFFMGN